MSKECVCGSSIANNRTLCKECAEIYGIDPDEWPEWLRWKFNDLRREHIADLTHNHMRLDEIESNGRGGYRAKRDFTLRGCRTETHLYQDRKQHGG